MKNIPKNFRKVIDELKSETVEDIFKQAEELQKRMLQFKELSFSKVEDYMSLLANEYNVDFSDSKGNITLTNYDGTLKILKTIHSFIKFDEKLQIAKALIDKCITKWSDGSREELKTLVNFAFEVDKQGKVSTERILGLRRIGIEDEDWQNAMQAITDSLEVTRSKAYIRLYKRNNEYENWQQFSLDLATVGDR
jgi:molybdopterin-biosynthesis enzyme MoeA-like protein